MIIYFLIIFIMICIFNKPILENYDGTGKSFSRYYKPNYKCTTSRNCYPGMYWANNFSRELHH